MKKLIIIAAIVLAGCGQKPPLDVGVAPPAKMPELPRVLQQRAERLPNIEDRSLGGINRDGITTDMRYNDLAYRYNAIVDAWSCVRNSLNERSTEAIDKCFKSSEGNNQ